MRKPMHNNNRGGGRGGQRRYNNNRGGNNYRGNGGGNYNEDGINQHQLRNAANLRNKYLGLARDAMASGDRVLAENYLQHADHYVRLQGIQQERQRASQPSNPDQPREQGAEGGNQDDRQDNSAPQEDDSAAFGEHMPAFLYGRVVSGSGNNAPQNTNADAEESTGQ